MKTSSVEERLTRIEREFDELTHPVLAHDANLLTRSLPDFEPVSGSRIENWLD
jgi:hypothetical protein